MNVIVLMSDSLRPDHLQCFGNEWVRTPNSARFAETAAIFENSWVGSFPTVPNRTDLFTGRFGEPFHPWLPLDFGALTLPEILAKNGYVTQFMCDTSHLIQGGHSFDYPFHGWQMIRGNEVDRYALDTKPHDFPFTDYSRVRADIVNLKTAQSWRNFRSRHKETDWTTYKTFQASIDWLEENRGQEKFFLWIDEFDPHEPQVPPQHYEDLYDPGYKGNKFLTNVSPAKLSPAEIHNIKSRYAGSVSFVDTHFGRLLNAIDTMGLADNTIVVWLSDHGTHLDEHGMIITKNCIYSEVARTLMMARVPGGAGSKPLAAGKRFKDLVQPADLAPTLLDFLGIDIPAVMQGVSYKPLFEGGSWNGREVAVTCGGLKINPDGTGDPKSKITARDQRWRLIDTVDPATRVLYDGDNDPTELVNVADKYPREVERLHGAIIQFLKTHEAPPQIVRLWETGHAGDMTGYQRIRPGLENWHPYWERLWDAKVIPV